MNVLHTIAAVERGYFWGVMRLGFEFDHFLPSSAEVTNKLSYTKCFIVQRMYSNIVQQCASVRRRALLNWNCNFS